MSIIGLKKLEKQLDDAKNKKSAIIDFIVKPLQKKLLTTNNTIKIILKKNNPLTQVFFIYIHSPLIIGIISLSRKCNRYFIFSPLQNAY